MQKTGDGQISGNMAVTGTSELTGWVGWACHLASHEEVTNPTPGRCTGAAGCWRGRGKCVGLEDADLFGGRGDARLGDGHGRLLPRGPAYSLSGGRARGSDALQRGKVR
jgi:hypothetical protein